MLGGGRSDVLSIWDRARLSVVCGSSAGIWLLRVPTALPVPAPGCVQLYLLFTRFFPAAGLCSVGSRFIDASRQVGQPSGQEYRQKWT